MAQAFTFDGPSKNIYLATTESFAVETMYSYWKIWAGSLTQDNAKYLQAFRSVGGDPTTPGKFLGSTYFILNGWKIIPTGSNHRLQIEGNLYTDDQSSPIGTTSGSYNIVVETTVSNLTDAQVVQTALEQSLEYQGTVSYDQQTGISGSLYPAGTYSQPVNNIAQAIQIANYYGFHKIIITDDCVINSNLNISNLNIEGIGGDINVVLYSPTSSNTKFTNVVLSGTQSLSSKINVNESIVCDLYNFDGILKECLLSCSITPAPNSDCTLAFCASSMAGTNSPTINLENSSGASLSMRSYSGGIRYVSCSDASFLSTIEFVAGRFNADSSNTTGFVSLRGVAALNNQSSLTLETGSLINAGSFNNINVEAVPDPVLSGKVDEIWKIHGLDSGSGVYVDTTTRVVDGIVQVITNTGTGSGAQTTILRV